VVEFRRSPTSVSPDQALRARLARARAVPQSSSTASTGCGAPGCGRVTDPPCAPLTPAAAKPGQSNAAEMRSFPAASIHPAQLLSLDHGQVQPLRRGLGAASGYAVAPSCPSTSPRWHADRRRPGRSHYSILQPIRLTAKRCLKGISSSSSIASSTQPISDTMCKLPFLLPSTTSITSVVLPSYFR